MLSFTIVIYILFRLFSTDFLLETTKIKIYLSQERIV